MNISHMVNTTRNNTLNLQRN